MRISKLEARKFHFLKHNFSECFVVVIVVGFCCFFCCFWCCLSSESSLLGFFNLGARKFIFPKYMKNIFCENIRAFLIFGSENFILKIKEFFSLEKCKKLFHSGFFCFPSLALNVHQVAMKYTTQIFSTKNPL